MRNLSNEPSQQQIWCFQLCTVYYLSNVQYKWKNHTFLCIHSSDDTCTMLCYIWLLQWVICGERWWFGNVYQNALNHHRTEYVKEDTSITHIHTPSRTDARMLMPYKPGLVFTFSYRFLNICPFKIRKSTDYVYRTIKYQYKLLSIKSYLRWSRDFKDESGIVSWKC